MTFKFLKIIGIGFILSVSTLANATLIDNGDYTTDTESGLDWLDWTETKGMTEIGALTQFSEAGWRAATGIEAGGLLENFFGDGYGPGEYTVGANNIPDYAQVKITFAQLVGVTNPDNVQVQGTYMLAGTGLYGVDNTTMFKGLQGYYPSWNQSGIALVRATTVSEPAIIALFALGLVCIGFARRRQY
jgi:hypothetical protein